MRKKTKTKPKLDKNISGSLAVIILKGIASDLRSKYKHLRIEAHPRSPTIAELFVGRRDVEHSVKVSLFNNINKWSATPSVNTFRTEYRITKNGKQIRKEVSNLVVNIEEPNSITTLESWLCDLIDVHVINVEEETCLIQSTTQPEK